MTRDAWLTGPRGRVLAVGIGLLALLLVWLVVFVPAQAWYQDRTLRLQQQQALLQRMRSVAGSLPEVRLASRSKPDSGGASMLTGATDAVAAADLQERVQAMASSAGTSLTAVETLPPSPVGQWHRISLRISLNAPWPVLMDLMRAVEQSPTRILIDDVHFHSATLVTHPTVLPIQASMVLYGFRPADDGRAS